MLVTGGAGFIGSHLVDKLIELGNDATVIDDLSYGKKQYINKKADFYELDIRDYRKLVEVIKVIRPEFIFHLAAIAATKETSAGWRNPNEVHQVNAIGTLNVLRAIIELDIDPRMVYASSAAVYGRIKHLPINEEDPTNPISPYGISKLTAEKYMNAYYSEYGVKSTSLRIFNVYGPRQTRYVMFDILRKLHENRNKLEVLGNGNQVRDYCYITDAVEAFILAAERNASIGKVFNIGSGKPTRINELVRKIIKITGSEKTEIHCTGESWRGDIPKLFSDTSKAKMALGFEPKVDLENGLIKLKEWFVKEYSVRYRSGP